MLTKAAAGRFVMDCMAARTDAHLLHLQTRSYAQHIALQEFYDGLVDLVDRFAETYMGMEGVFASFPAPGGSGRPADPKALIDAFLAKVQAVRRQCDDTPACANVLDDVLTLTYATRYKLMTLK